MEGFTNRQLQDARALLIGFSGKSIDEVLDLINERLNVSVVPETPKAAGEQGEKCPRCGRLVSVHKVNHAPAAMIGGDWKYYALCPDRKMCGWEEYR